ncbi:MAG: carboxypeptidase-like regulatory domain-containing protein [Bacteroidales bacterium]
MITGIVKDELNKPLQYANVFESDKDGKPLYINNVLKGTITNYNGLFSLNVAKDYYYVTASFSGMEKQTFAVVPGNLFLNFILKIKTLSEFEIKATKIRNYSLLGLLVGLIIYNS